MALNTNYLIASGLQETLSFNNQNFPKVHEHSLICLWAVHEKALSIESINSFIQLSNCSPISAWYAVFGYALLKRCHPPNDSIDYVSIAKPDQINFLVECKVLPASILNNQTSSIIFTAPDFN